MLNNQPMSNTLRGESFSIANVVGWCIQLSVQTHFEMLQAWTRSFSKTRNAPHRVHVCRCQCRIGATSSAPGHPSTYTPIVVNAHGLCLTSDVSACWNDQRLLHNRLSIDPINLRQTTPAQRDRDSPLMARQINCRCIVPLAMC